MLELTICHPPHDPLTLTLSPSTTGSELKCLLIPKLKSSSESEEEMRLVSGGRVIQDHLSLSSQGNTLGLLKYLNLIVC